MREGPHAEKLTPHTHTLTVLEWLFHRFTLLRHFSEQRKDGEDRKQNKNANYRIRDSSQQKKTVRARKNKRKRDRNRKMSLKTKRK